MVHGACEFCGCAIAECNEEKICEKAAKEAVHKIMNGRFAEGWNDYTRLYKKFTESFWGELFEAEIYGED